MNYKQTNQDLINQWNDQLLFLESSAKSFDLGNESEAKRLALSLRILFHDTNNSHSLLNQLGINNLSFLSTCDCYSPGNLVSSWPLLVLEVSPGGLRYIPLSDDSPNRHLFLLKFDDWWNQIIFDDKKNVFSRKDIILFVANKDGGAHVDPYWPEKFAELTKYNSLGFKDSNDNGAKNNPAYVSIRQIVKEFFISLNIHNFGKFTRQQLKEHQYEMRFIKNTRFIWSSTDISCSSEVKTLVNSYKKEPRKLYIQKYSNNKTFLCIS